MFIKFKKWIAGSAVMIAIAGFLYKLYKSHIKNEVRKKELKRKAKEIEKEGADTVYKTNKLITEIEDIDINIDRKKENLKKFEEKTKNKVIASNLPEDKKLKMFNDLFKDS